MQMGVDRYTCEKVHVAVDQRLDSHDEDIRSLRDCQVKLTEVLIEVKTWNQSHKKRVDDLCSKRTKWWETKWFDRLMTVLLMLFVVIVLTALGRDYLLSEIIKLGGG